eukprot:5110229-Amphidinium_carterae.2
MPQPSALKWKMETNGLAILKKSLLQQHRVHRTNGGKMGAYRTKILHFGAALLAGRQAPELFPSMHPHRPWGSAGTIDGVGPAEVFGANTQPMCHGGHWMLKTCTMVSEFKKHLWTVVKEPCRLWKRKQQR